MDPKASDDQNGPVEYDSDEDAVGRQSVMSIERQSRLQQQENHQNKHSHHEDKQTEDVQTKEQGQIQVKQVESEPVTIVNVLYSAAENIETSPVQPQNQQNSHAEVHEQIHQEVHHQNNNLESKEQTQTQEVESNRFNHIQKQRQNSQQITLPLPIESQPTTETLSHQIPQENKQHLEQAPPETTHHQEVDHQPSKTEVEQSTEIVPVLTEIVPVQDSQIHSNQQSYHPSQTFSKTQQTQQLQPPVQEKHFFPPTASEIIKDKVEEPQQSKIIVESPPVAKEVELEKVQPTVVYAEIQQAHPEPSEERVLIPLVNQATNNVAAESPKKERVVIQTERVLIESIRQKPLKEQKNSGGPKGCNACQIM